MLSNFQRIVRAQDLMVSLINFTSSFEVRYFLLNIETYYRNTGEINKTQQQGIITCIPNGGKNRNGIKNWRPINYIIE